MKAIIFSILAIFGYTITNSQTNNYHPFPESNTIWNYNYQKFCFSNGHANESYSIVISSDTIIQGLTYQKLIVSHKVTNSIGSCGAYPIGYKGAIRQDIPERKVYFIPPASSREQLLYDFNLQVGDTVQGYIEAALIDKDIVISIDSVLIENSYRKRWKINDCYNIYFIEGIGSTYGLIENSLGCITDQADFSLSCVQQNGRTIYPNSAINCQNISSISSIHRDFENFTLYPNPYYFQTPLATTEPLMNATLTIFNILGHPVEQLKNIKGSQIQINKDKFTTGMYLFHFTQEERMNTILKFFITVY